MNFITRDHELSGLDQLLQTFPAVAILGPRQCGKTTLAKQIQYSHFFDLENPNDLAKFEAPQLLLEKLNGLIVIDEIQRKPGLFPLLRYLIDNHGNQQYLILGSASRDLIQQSSESLAGRIAYHELAGFHIADLGFSKMQELWIQGGFPRSVLAKTEAHSVLWRNQYISTFLERDIPALGIKIPANTLRRFWTMLSHYHGQIINYAELGRSFGISDMTVRKYIDILNGTYMIRILQPWHNNTAKRLIKQPKLYLRDSGIFHSLSSIENYNQLISHPKLGASWEGFAMEITIQALQKSANEIYFWRTHNGAELDLFWQKNGKNWGVEFKYADAPKLTRSMKTAYQDLELAHLWVIYPGKDSYPLMENISALSLNHISRSWTYPDNQ